MHRVIISKRRLSDHDIELRLICVDGYVLQHPGMRTTVDVGAFFDESEEVRKMIKEIGDRYGLNNDDELWLDNSVQSMNPQPPEEICETLYQFPNLKVMMAPLLYVAGMKWLEEYFEKNQENILKKLR